MHAGGHYYPRCYYTTYNAIAETCLPTARCGHHYCCRHRCTTNRWPNGPKQACRLTRLKAAAGDGDSRLEKMLLCISGCGILITVISWINRLDELMNTLDVAAAAAAASNVAMPLLHMRRPTAQRQFFTI